MIMFLEKYNMDKVFVALMGVVAVIFFCITLKDILVTKRLLRQKMGITKIVLDSMAYLVAKSRAFVKKTFLSQIVNNGNLISFDIVIDDSYLTNDSHAYIKKR